MSLSMRFIKKSPYGSRDRASFTFQNLDPGKASTEDTWHLEIPSVGSCQYQCVYKTFIQMFLMVQELWAIFTFLQFGNRQSLDQWTMIFCNNILSISTGMRNFTNVFHKVQEIGSVSLFQNLDLGKASTDEIWHLKKLRIESINMKVCLVSFLRNTVSGQNRISKSCLCDWSGTKK